MASKAMLGQVGCLGCPGRILTYKALKLDEVPSQAVGNLCG